MNEFETRKRHEDEAIKEVAQRRTAEKERGREEVFREEPSQIVTSESITLPICVRASRMLITGTLPFYYP